MKPVPAQAAPDMPPDEELIRRITSGDRMAFHTLAGRYMKIVHAAVYRMHPFSSEAEDLVQETWLRVWSKAGTYREDGGASVSTWIYRIASNLCIDHKRRGKPTSDIELHEIADTTDSAEKKMQDRQTQKLVKDALASLPARQRMALVLTYYQGLSNAEAAESMETSVKSIEGLLVRARKTLQVRLKKHEGVLMS